jgi:protein-tyrosine phosphatase
MVDIHCHILPGMDDGADSFEEAVEMAEMAIEDGITHVVGTPHANEQFKFDPDLIRKRRDELQEKIGDRLILATGCDFHLNFENLQDLPADKTKYTINQKNYLLIELNDFAIPPNIEGTLHHLQLLGISPILTHPERNPLIQRHPEHLRRWLHLGCYVQITAQSILGRFGSTAQKAAEEWLGKEMVHFFASDAHSTTRRPLQLGEAYQSVAARVSEARAQALFRENPLAAFEGRQLPYEPKQPTVDAKAPAPRRKRFSFF